jgi:PKD repeat protein
VSFTGSATGGSGTYTYSWAFGDGVSSTSTSQSPSHSYSSPGSYTATLTVSDSAGLQSTASVAIAVRPPVVVTAAGAPSGGSAPQLVTFTGSAIGGDNGPYTYAWDFGDGGTASTAGATYVYAAGGNYTAKLTATDVAGDSGWATVAINVLGVNLVADQTLGSFPLIVGFTANAAGGSGTYASYAWTFGDGTTATTTTGTTTHTYTASGTFSATVQVTDSTPATATSAAVSIVVTVPPMTASAAGSAPTTGLAPLTVSFTGTAAGGTPPYTYAWDFGDGSPAQTGLTSPATTYTYNVPGAFTATLTVTDSTAPTAKTATDTVAISVRPPVPGISGVSPAFGPETGGTPVTISGTYFENATAVKFGSKPATFTAPTCDGLGNCTIVATSPLAAAGTVNIIVITPGGTTPAANDQFTYDLAWFSTTATGPSAREGAALVNDGTQVVMFGGTTGLLSRLNDTWLWNGSAWTAGPAQPLLGGASGRINAGIAYDSAHTSAVMFGGDCTVLILVPCQLNDTWTWNPTTNVWTQAQASTGAQGTNQPGPRTGAMMVFDSSLNQVVLFGGYDLAGSAYLNDTWKYNFNTSKWTQISASNCASTSRPACRAYGAIGRDSSGQVVLFGGLNASGLLGDTWTGTGGAWNGSYNLSAPSARQMASMAYFNHPGGGTAAGLELFGGQGAVSSQCPAGVCGDTWTWNGRWVQIYGTGGSGQPPARYDAAAATDSSGAVVLFGGNSGSAVLSDTWLLK